MRDPKRITPFLQEFAMLWRQFPDLRFGQFLHNLLNEMGDPFYFEEEKFLKEAKEIVSKWLTK